MDALERNRSTAVGLDHFPQTQGGHEPNAAGNADAVEQMHTQPPAKINPTLAAIVTTAVVTARYAERTDEERQAEVDHPAHFCGRGVQKAINCTVHVGNIPSSFVAIKNSKQLLTEVFVEFGPVLSVQLREKAGERKSWAFVTFLEKGARALALRAKLSVADTERGAGELAELKVTKADVETQLRKSDGTGALADQWSAQERKVML